MTTALVKTEIARFLKSTSPEVLCIRGKWGVGKTFSWQQFLKQASTSEELGLKHYAYISLFGLNSLEALKTAILENSVSSKRIAFGPSLEEYLAFAKGKSILGVASFLRQKDIGELLTKAMFLSVKERIVCFDDLERRGSTLELRDVLGLASMLKEQRKCKVVLLLNDEQLAEEDKSDFTRLLEKVVDVSLVFDPTPEEAADIAFMDGSPTSQLLRPKVIQLGITNIRIIKKIERLANLVFEVLGSFRDEIVAQAMSTVTLGGWAALTHAGAPDVVPPLNYIKRYNRDVEAILAKDELSEEKKKKWSQILASFEFWYSDDLNFAILEGVERGYFGRDALNTAANKIVAAMTNNSENNSFTQAWVQYHESLTIDDDEILNSLFNGAMENLPLIKPVSLNSTVLMLRQNNRDKQASELVNEYMSANTFARGAFAEEFRMWGQEAVDRELEAAFRLIDTNFQDTRDPVEVMKRITNESGWSNVDIDLLAKLTPSEFEKIFEALEGPDLRRVAKFIVGLGDHDGENYKAMGSAVTEGLKLIAAKSPLRAERVASYGVDLSTIEVGN